MLFKVGAEETQWIETRENLRGEAEKDPAHHHGDPHQAKHVATLLAGVDGIVAKRFGPNIKRMVHKFVCCLVKTDTVAEAVELAQRDLPLLVQHLQQGPDRKAVRLPPSPP
ncbi:MAG: hypothetical protein DRI90_11870 [Deltaproteobacteria bacterium]|nr:MAG: hypothetical protein DRI90_11870 [Deltaproteobacteria bacterium]